MIYVTLVNRTNKNLIGTWNGRQYSLAPGKHEFPEAQACKFKDQNPVMGSADPTTWPVQKKYLMGIVEYKDDCSPIEQSNAIEVYDRTLLGPGKQDVQVVEADGLFRQSDRAPLPAGTISQFKPND